MTRSTELTHRRAQGDPEFIEWVRVMVLRVPQDAEENRSVRKIEP